MISYLYLNEKIDNTPFLLLNVEKFIKKEKNFEIFQKYKNIMIFSFVDIYEINFLFKFEGTKILLKDFLKDLNLNNYKNFKEVIEYSKKNNKLLKILIFENDKIFLFAYIKGEEIIYLYGKIINDNLILKDIIDFFLKFNNFKVAIIENEEEKVINLLDVSFNKIQNLKRNIFSLKEIKNYIEILDVHTGLVFYLIKNYINEIFTFIKIFNLDSIKNEHIELKNSIKELFNKKFRSNKKCHILNISNILNVRNLKFFKNNKKNKFYVKILENIKTINNSYFYHIKEMYILNRKNILKIKEKFNRSNEILLIYNNNNYKYILKLTKSISKQLNEKVKEVKDFKEIKKVFNL